MRALAVACVFTALLLPVPAAAAELSPSPRPGCGAPPYQWIAVEPASAAPGDNVTVTVTVRDEPCYPDETGGHEVELFAARQPYRDPAPLASGTTNASGRFVYVDQPRTSSVYYLTVKDGQRRGGTGSASVTVGRDLGSCAGRLRLSAPSAVPIGTPVVVEGISSDTATVGIAFRKRGQAAFVVRRTVHPDPQTGAFRATYTPGDDYRVDAVGERCDSPPILVQAAPVINGPAKVRRGSIVTLTVRATPGIPLAVAFRRQATALFTVRRTGTADNHGTLTTTYRADVDYEYYATERPGQQSARRITQAR